MADESSSYAPSDCEKLSHKFLLDSVRRRREELRRRRMEANESAAEVVEEIETAPIMEGPAEELPAQPEAPAPAVSIGPAALPEGKAYFRIGEVSDLLGVEAHVLRYWESEFPLVRPTKSSGQRVYRRKDVLTLIEIRHLLHVENLSIREARRTLRERRRENQVPPAHTTGTERPELLKEMAQELRALIRLAQG